MLLHSASVFSSLQTMLWNERDSFSQMVSRTLKPVTAVLSRRPDWAIIGSLSLEEITGSHQPELRYLTASVKPPSLRSPLGTSSARLELEDCAETGIPRVRGGNGRFKPCCCCRREKITCSEISPFMCESVITLPWNIRYSMNATGTDCAWSKCMVAQKDQMRRRRMACGPVIIDRCASEDCLGAGISCCGSRAGLYFEPSVKGAILAGLIPGCWTPLLIRLNITFWQSCCVAAAQGIWSWWKCILEIWNSEIWSILSVFPTFHSYENGEKEKSLKKTNKHTHPLTAVQTVAAWQGDFPVTYHSDRLAAESQQEVSCCIRASVSLLGYSGTRTNR